MLIGARSKVASQILFQTTLVYNQLSDDRGFHRAPSHEQLLIVFINGLLIVLERTMRSACAHDKLDARGVDEFQVVMKTKTYA